MDELVLRRQENDRILLNAIQAVIRQPDRRVPSPRSTRDLAEAVIRAYAHNQ